MRGSFWLALALLLCSQLALAQRTAPQDVPTDRLIVKWRKGTAADEQIKRAGDRRISQQRLDAFAARAGVRLVPYRAMSGDAQVIKLDRRRSRGEARAIAARLAADPDVEFAVADEKRFPSLTPTDGYFVGGLQPNLYRINVPFAWDITTGSASLVVAVIDTGILPHPELAGRVLAGRDFVSNNYQANDGDGRDASAADPGDWVSWSDVQDPASPFDSACLYAGIYDTYSSWHGTHMAGIIAANANNNNGSGIAGINWSSKILPVRVMGKCGGFDSDIIDGMRWAAGLPVPGVPDNPAAARVLNMSLGGPGSCNAAWQSAIDQVTALNKIVVVAAGNEGIDLKDVTPASCQKVATVAAFSVDAFGNLLRSFYSNFGGAATPNLFAAPGDYIYSASDGGFQGPANDGILYPEYGTSGAAAHVSGVVSLMLSANPALTHPQVLQILRDSSVPIGDWAGSGKVDAFRAVGNSQVFHGSAPVPVTLTINGPDSVYEGNNNTTYTATVTWSDTTVTAAYPMWSATAPFAPQAGMGDTGKLPPYSVNGDQTVTLHASFRANGVTLTADKVVAVLDNYIVSIAVNGPSSVFLNSPSPTRFSATATWRDGRVVPGDVAWSVVSGAATISSTGFLIGTGAGPVTVRGTNSTQGTVIGEAVIDVVPGAPATYVPVWSCASESVAGLTLEQAQFVDVGTSTDIVPLCDRKVIVADRNAKRVDVVDVQTGLIVRSWSLSSPTLPSANISRMLLPAGSSKLFVSFFGADSGLASIDLANPDAAPQYIALPLPNYTSHIIDGDDGQVWVMHSQFNDFIAFSKVARYDASSGALLGSFDLPRQASGMLYAKASRILVTTLTFSGGGRAAYDVSPSYALTEREYLTDAGGTIGALSPDGTRILLGTSDLDVSNLTFQRGRWSGQVGAFSADGKRLAVQITGPAPALLGMSSAQRHVVLTEYPRFTCDVPTLMSVRFSPSGAYLYGYAQCTAPQSGGEGPGQIIWVALGEQPTPDDIAFAAQAGAAPGATATSSAAVLNGFSGTASLSVTGGEVSVNGGTFAATASASPGDSVRLRMQAPADPYATAVATLRAGAMLAEFRATTGAALPPQWWLTSCGAEEQLGNAAVAFADIDSSAGLIALCNGRLLIGNRKHSRVDLFDVRARAAVRTWHLDAAPNAMRLIPGTSTLLVVTDSSNIARVDLDSGEVANLAVGGRPFDVEAGEPGQFIVVRQMFPTFNQIKGDTMAFHDLASGSLLASHFIDFAIAAATHVRYDPVGKLIYTADEQISPTKLARISYTPATHAIVATHVSMDVADYPPDMALSPDATRIALPTLGLATGIRQIAAADLQQGARWESGPFPRSAHFRHDNAKLLIGSEWSSSYQNGIQLFDTATQAIERSWILPHCPSSSEDSSPFAGLPALRRVRFSPSGTYAYALESCGSGKLARVFWLPTSAASTMPQLDPVAFTPKAGVALNSLVTSNEITISGLRGLTVPFNVVDGNYSINGGSFTFVNTGVKDGDRVRVRREAWFEAGVTVTATLNIGGVLVPFNVTAGVASGSDTMPDPFRLVILKNRPLDTEFVSNTFTVTGINNSASISVIGGQYSIDGGAYTSAAGTVTNGQTVTVRMTSANTTSTSSAAILTIGGMSSSLSVSTAATDTTPDNFAFPARPRAPRNVFVESAPITLSGLGASAAISVEGGEYRIGAGPYTSVDGFVDNGAVVNVRVLSGATLGATATATLLVGPRSADFVVTTGSTVRTDLGGDGKSDVLWRNSSTGENYLYPMDGRQILASEGYVRTVADQAWQVAGTGDFDGDGRSDILWRNSSTGQNYIYLMNGKAIVGEGYIRTVADQNWHVAAVGDLDGDGKDDIVWRNSATGENYVYFMDGLAIKPSEGYLRSVVPSWFIAGAGDFDGDGKSDLLWRNTTTGENYLYPMDGRSIKPTEGFIRTVASANWQVKGVGDFDGDGKADVLWRNVATGENYLYPMDGRSIKPTEGSLRTVAINWQIVAVGDYDGDGKSDILWRNSSTGENYLYPMDGKSIKPTEGFIRSVPLVWNAVGK